MKWKQNCPTAKLQSIPGSIASLDPTTPKSRGDLISIVEGFNRAYQQMYAKVQVMQFKTWELNLKKL